MTADTAQPYHPAPFVAGKESDGEVQPSQRRQKGAVQGNEVPCLQEEGGQASHSRVQGAGNEEVCRQASAGPGRCDTGRSSEEDRYEGDDCTRRAGREEGVEFDRQGDEQPPCEVTVQREVPRTAA